jgi:subtilisin family serine protease
MAADPGTSTSPKTVTVSRTSAQAKGFIIALAAKPASITDGGTVFKHAGAASSTPMTSPTHYEYTATDGYVTIKGGAAVAASETSTLYKIVAGGVSYYVSVTWN